ncbi:hypothetical protein BDA99DRAFT_556956 [Phascolomyces articulosus]|uniref:Uncharacterized protein n=1 Tax=Phascolomyces articulosus TaxID=60185 RepID=A0AAD5KH73_9FUNG|nr:hypothetical protein BDA99DRAFT_556956 [Phascolomyces articulosus]
MRHLTKLPSMSERIATLQVKFVHRAQFLPEDALLTQLLLGLEAQKRSYWSKLCNKSDIVKLLPQSYSDISGTMLKTIIRQYLVDTFENIRSAPIGAKLLCARLPKLGVDPIMWIPMTNKERSRCIRWRLPGGRPKPCPRCPSQILTKNRAIHCLCMHHRLQLPSYHEDPLSHILNQPSKSKPASLRRIQHLSSKWPIVCKILAELDAYQHPGSNLQQYYDDSPGQALVKWITSPPPSEADTYYMINIDHKYVEHVSEPSKITTTISLLPSTGLFDSSTLTVSCQQNFMTQLYIGNVGVMTHRNISYLESSYCVQRKCTSRDYHQTVFLLLTGTLGWIFFLVKTKAELIKAISPSHDKQSRRLRGPRERTITTTSSSSKYTTMPTRTFTDASTSVSMRETTVLTVTFTMKQSDSTTVSEKNTFIAVPEAPTVTTTSTITSPTLF